jgi:hypothetical protein
MAQPTPRQPTNTPPPADGAKKGKGKYKKRVVEKLSRSQMEQMIKDAATEIEKAIAPLAISPKDEYGRDILPLTDTLGKVKKATAQFRSDFKTDMHTFTGFTPTDTVADELDNDVIEMRRLLREVHEKAEMMAEKWDDAIQKLADQQALYAEGDEIDEEIRKNEEALKAREEKLAGLKAAKAAKGKVGKS